MSKSKNNGVDPQELIEQYGADTARLFVMSASPPEQTLEWNDSGVEGSYRFMKRVWNFVTRNAELIKPGFAVNRTQPVAFSDEAKTLRRDIHLILRQANYDYERMQYNTVASALYKILNTLEAAKLPATPENSAALAECVSILLRLLSPVCPHISHVLWTDLGYAECCGELLDVAWPGVDESALVQDEIELMLQVNGKLRGSIKVPASADKAAIEAAALASEDVAKFSEGKPPKKIIVVPGRLVNVVV
jgi:leucyl-tRNA synthetase